MSTPLDFESCRQNVTRLADWYHNNAGTRNESTTRLHIIDRLLFDCLGWERDHVESEESHDGEFADYTLQFPRRLLILEAKREGTYFELPLGHTRSEYSISSLLRTIPALRAAMEQVAGYCQKRGVPYAAVSNGHQLVLFIANRSDGIPPFNGAAVVFDSLDRMRDDFFDLWNLLSPPAIEQQLLHTRLIGNAGRSFPLSYPPQSSRIQGLRDGTHFRAA